MWQFRFSPEMPSLAQIELPPFLAQLVVQLLVQLAGALLHLSRAELPEPVGRLEAVLLGYLPERAVVVVFQVPPYLTDALLLQPFVGGLPVDSAEFLAEGRYTHAEHPRQFLHAVRAVAGNGSPSAGTQRHTGASAVSRHVAAPLR